MPCHRDEVASEEASSETYVSSSVWRLIVGVTLILSGASPTWMGSCKAFSTTSVDLLDP
jgi:hypothetical protein